MKRYPCYLIFSIILTTNTLIANANPDENTNITIREKKETYTFTTGDDEHPVQIKQESRTVYSCNEFRTTIPYVAFYDDLSRIDELRIFVNGRRAKYISPKYEYYSIDNIFYSDARVCYFSLPLEKKGEESAVELEKTMLDPRYFTSIYFDEAFTVQQKEIKLVVPRWMKVELKEMNFAGAGIQKQTEYNEKADADIYTYRVSSLKARISEPQAPGPSYLYPHLLILCKSADSKKGKQQYFNNVDDLYAWYRSLVQKVGNDPAAIKTKALEISKGAATDLDKIKMVYNWVQDNIRYIAFEDGIAGFKPEKAQDVLQRKYGDCKGMANLTSELLKALGFDARLCWIGTNHIAYDYTTPSMAVDNHMICAVNFGGKRYFLDATETYIGFDQYAERIQSRQVLIENGPAFILDRIPASD
ncbi:MAG TPA: transglutaminase domain-containing protein, partial [Chitinophaga sp.]